MAMIDRYKKSGGFVQLLKVIETSGKTKREQLMTIIRAETPQWADAIEQKSLTFNRILSWSPEIVLDVLSRISHLPFATALKSLTDDEYQVFLSKLSHQEKRKIDIVYAEIKPSPVEISSSVFKIVGETRDLITTGILKVDKFDSELFIPNNFETNLLSTIEVPKSEKIAAPSTGSFFDKKPAPKTEKVSSELILVGQNNKNRQPTNSAPNGPFNLATENRPEALKTKIRELAQQLSLVLQQKKQLEDEIELLKKNAS